MEQKTDVYDEASIVEAEDGVVHIDGPDGVDIKLTPNAALILSDDLLEKSAKARGQRVRRDANW